MPRVSSQKRSANQTITDDAALVVTVRSEAAGARVGATDGVRIKHGSSSTLPPPCCIQMPKYRSEGTPKHMKKLHGKINLKQKLLPTALHHKHRPSRCRNSHISQIAASTSYTILYSSNELDRMPHAQLSNTTLGSSGSQYLSDTAPLHTKATPTSTSPSPRSKAISES